MLTADFDVNLRNLKATSDSANPCCINVDKTLALCTDWCSRGWRILLLRFSYLVQIPMRSETCSGCVFVLVKPGMTSTCIVPRVYHIQQRTVPVWSCMQFQTACCFVRIFSIEYAMLKRSFHTMPANTTHVTTALSVSEWIISLFLWPTKHSV